MTNRFSFFVPRTKIEIRKTKNEWRHYRVSIFVRHTKYERRFVVPYFVFRFSFFVQKTTYGTNNRMPILGSLTKIENRYNKPFFVFSTACEIRNMKRSVQIRVSYAIRNGKNGLLYRFSFFVSDTKFDKRLLVP